ncbi:hypothetical protein [Sphingomonas yabuuchiae]|uniref:hypothetical protein n=1 Tax=Sphingomonas yabuuchiae TaxID=172044 RepID=UPI001FA01AA7|nr:hypothetical protein [uncultured Sphingomonas sp.]HIV76085.1 hypothetical protein [Candidatus Sphingomonas excrementigallinarum]
MIDEASSLFRGLVTAYRNRLHEPGMTINRLIVQLGAFPTVAGYVIQGPVFANRSDRGGQT